MLQRIPLVPHLQRTYLLLLYCGAPGCTYLLWTLPAANTAASAVRRNAVDLRCLKVLLAPGRRSQTRALGVLSSVRAWGAWAGFGDSGLPTLCPTQLTGRPGRAHFEHAPPGHARRASSADFWTWLPPFCPRAREGPSKLRNCVPRVSTRLPGRRSWRSLWACTETSLEFCCPSSSSRVGSSNQCY